MASITDERIAIAKASLKSMLGVTSLAGLRFLDVGCGSGLFSLAARRLGAAAHSFDYDALSVACAEELRRRYCQDDAAWTIEQGSILDAAFVERLGVFDVVYAWGVLHHTGDLWAALGRAAGLVAPNGRLFVSVYNDQGGYSLRWKRVKRFSNTAPRPLPWLLSLSLLAWFEARTMLAKAVRLQNPLPFAHWRDYKKNRGMSRWRDWLDWMGGYPFEVAKPEDVFHFFRERGFCLERLKTCGGGLGCNEFVLRRAEDCPCRDARTGQSDQFGQTGQTDQTGQPGRTGQTGRDA